MNATQRVRIAELIDELDRLISRDGAAARIDIYGGGPDECSVIANQAGYLCVGIEFLKAALAEPTDERGSVPVALNGVLLETSDVRFDGFVRAEPEWEPKPGRSALAERVAGFGCLLLLATGFVLMIAGAVSIFRTLFR